MNIIYCATIRLPTEKAHGLQIMKTSAAMVQAGAKLELVIPDRDNAITTDPFDYYHTPKNFLITKLLCKDIISNTRLGIFGHWLQSYLFVRAILRQKYTSPVWYTRDLPLAYWLTKTDRSLFYEIHSLPPRPTWLHKQTWQRSRGIIVISDGLRKELIAAGVPSEKIIVVRDSVDVAQFQNVPPRAESRAKLTIPFDQKVVVYTGHLYGWKGADTLAKAAKKLESENIHTYIVGGTDEEIRTFREEFSAPTVHVIGRRDHQEMPLWLSAADLLAIPNSARYKIGALYTSPLKLFEYMAANRPIVATDVPSLREVLQEKAIFSAPDDPESLAAAIRRGFEEYSVWQTKADALAIEVQEYSWEKRGIMILDFLKHHA